MVMRCQVLQAVGSSKEGSMISVTSGHGGFLEPPCASSLFLSQTLFYSIDHSATGVTVSLLCDVDRRSWAECSL